MVNASWPRRVFLRRAIGTSGLAAFPLLNMVGASSAATETPLDTSTVIEEGGFFTQNWFLESFLELADDLQESTGEEKRFAIIWEQKGCPYCRETHMVNFSTPKIRDWIRDRFNIVQLDIWGSREVTDFDGEVLEERELARKSRVSFTPTIQFFPASLDDFTGMGSVDAEVARMPGYFRRFHFMTMFEYIFENAYAKQDFQRYLLAKLQRIEESGQQADVW